MSAASRSPEMRADERRFGQRLPRHSATLTITSSPTCMPKVSLMTCSRSMSRYRMQCVADSARRDASSDDGLALERVPGHEARARIVLSLDDDGHLLRQQLGDARLMRIEIMRARRIEQRQHAHHALGWVANRAGQNLVGRRHVARDLGDVIDDDGALLQLHPGHQMLLCALQRFGRHGISAASHRHGRCSCRGPRARRARSPCAPVRSSRSDRTHPHRRWRSGSTTSRASGTNRVRVLRDPVRAIRAWSAAPVRAAGIPGPAARAGERMAAGAPRCARADRRTCRLTTPSELHVLAAHRERIHARGPHRRARRPGIRAGSVIALAIASLTRSSVVAEIPFIRRPDEFREAVVDHHPFKLGMSMRNNRP